MNAPHIANAPALSRRRLLKGVGASVALPFLDAMVPAFAKGADAPPARLVAMCAGLGFHTPYLFPEETGRDYGLSPYLAKLKDHRSDFTVISGLSHPNQAGNNGHASEMTWLTSAARPGLAGFKNTISLDQLIAQEIGIETRFPYLALSNSGRSLSWTSNGVGLPGQTSPSKLFKALFVNGTEREVAAELRLLERGRSILDTVSGEAQKLNRELGKGDREKLEEYLTSVRELEQRLQQSEGWAKKPKPVVEAAPPTDVADRQDAIAKQRLMYDMMVLALQTDSTRTMTYALSGMNAVPSNLPGVKSDWHNLSHHGKDEAKLEELKIIEEAEFTAFGEFVGKLKAVQEGGKSLLDSTAVLYGSNLGNASSHNTKNLPIVLAGGGFKHGAYVAHDADDNTPLANLFVTLAQHMGVGIDQFGSSTKAGLAGLERI